MRAISVCVVVLMLGFVAGGSRQACAQAISAYHGNWAGAWSSNRGGGGQVKMLIQAGGANTAYAHISLTNAIVPGFSKEIRFQNGTMMVDDQNVTMTFSLKGNQMSVDYQNKSTGDTGRYTLARE